MKNYFIACKISSSWPRLPKGKVISPSSRHLTLLFFGKVDFLPLAEAFSQQPTLKTPLKGIFSEFVTLQNTCALKATFEDESLLAYQRALKAYYEERSYRFIPRDFLPHVSVCRDAKEPLLCVPTPFTLSSVHLYQSLGGLVYEPILGPPLQH